VTAYEQLTIDTPEQIALEFPLAGVGSRCLAMVIDSLIQAAIGLIVLIASVLLGIGLGTVVQPFTGSASSAGLWVFAFMILLLFSAWYGYFAVFEIVWRGQTPGKRALGLRVLNDDGSPVRWPAALTRNLLRAVDFLPLAYGIGLVAMLCSRDFKRLGDLAAGTVVVYLSTEKEAQRKIPEAPPLAPPVPLDLDEQRAVLDLAERAAGLTKERVEELAALPTPLVGSLDGERAAARLLGMANYLAGRH